MTITTEQALMVLGCATTITTGIFWGAFLLGRLHSRVERVEHNVGDLSKDIIGLGNRMDRAGDKMSDLADEIQKMPANYLTRVEALHWRGSRAEDEK